MNEESLISAISGSTYVVHVASPFYFAQTEEEIIPPAINGTTAAMKACQAAGVRRCVVTSSGYAIFQTAEKPADNTYNESHWSDPDRPGGMEPYPKSKVLAEKAAWDFHRALPDDQKFELTVCNPGFVLGPPLVVESGSSVSWCKGLMEGKMGPPPMDLPCVDVRDVAKAHLLAIKN